MGHAVEGGRTDKDFCGLRIVRACSQRVSEDGFEAKHAGFSETALVIARLSFPRCASDLPDAAQIGVTRMWVASPVAMLPDVRVSPRWNDDRTGAPGL
jgi:hypothetical protein